MLCARCGKETPDDSVYCEHCGFALEDEEEAPAQFDAFSANVPVGGERPPVDGIRRTSVDAPLVDLPTPPVQPRLSKARIMIIGVIGALFSAAVILLAWAILMRVLGL